MPVSSGCVYSVSSSARSESGTLPTVRDQRLRKLRDQDQSRHKSALTHLLVEHQLCSTAGHCGVWESVVKSRIQEWGLHRVLTQVIMLLDQSRIGLGNKAETSNPEGFR